MQPKFRIVFTIFSLAIFGLTCSWFIYDHTQDQIIPAPEALPEFTIDAEILAAEDDEAAKNQILIKIIYELLKHSHYSPKTVDDDFSTKVYDLYLERLDYNKRFFLSEDIKALEYYRTQLDDEIKGGSLHFFDLSYDLLDKRENQVMSWYSDLLGQPFDYTKNETLDFDPENISWAANETQLKARWRQFLKYEVVSMLSDKMDMQEKAIADQDTAVVILSEEDLEKEVRGKILKRYDDWKERLTKLDRGDRRTVYLNAIANLYGPHTEYFPPVSKDNFDISMSGQLEGIGARLIDKDGYIKITSLVPGGPAALQGHLEAEDKIIDVQQEKGEPVNIVGYKIDDAVKLIRGKKGTKVTLNVKKLDGSMKKIVITRDVVEIEETYAKSAITELNGSRVGLINLPKFYADFNGTGGHSSAADVRSEIKKLNAEKVDGIILDLRNNGGGSLRDAIEMGGLFVDRGPICQVKQRTGKPEVLEDIDRGTEYDGALVVLVNHFSASASEIFAAAIQDYDRGIVLGSNSSFGKGTVQQFLDLDRYLRPEYAGYRPMGAIKVTLQKFYRINGGSTQLKGVTPDIIVPDAYSFMKIGEQDHEYVMEWDKVAPADFERWQPHWKETKVIQSSKGRIAADSTFTLIHENARRLKDQRDRTSFPLNLEAYRAEAKQLDKMARKYENINRENKELKVYSPKTDAQAIAGDEKRKNRVEAWHKNIRKDPYLQEAIRIIKDMN